MSSPGSCKHGLPPVMCAVCNGIRRDEPDFHPMRESDEPRLKKSRDKQEWVGRGRNMPEPGGEQLRKAYIGHSRYKIAEPSILSRSPLTRSAQADIIAAIAPGLRALIDAVRACPALKPPTQPTHVAPAYDATAKPPKNRVRNEPTEPVVKNARVPKPNTRRRY